MDIYTELFSSHHMLNEQLSREIAGVLPEDGPGFVILDREGNYWPSDDAFVDVLMEQGNHLRQMCDRIDDGGDPILTQVRDFAVVATQLQVGAVDCGYLFVFLPEYGPEAAMANMALVETLLNQVELIGRLIDKNNRLHQRELRELSLKVPV